MAKGSGTISITIFDDSKTLDDQKCLAKYFEVLEVIEGKIKEFNKQTHNGCEEWLNINEHINNKEKELTECYKQNFLTVDLNHSEKVKAFRDQRANYPECSNKPAYSAEVPVKLKAKTEHSCGAKKDCTEITEPGKQKAELKEKESKSKPEVGTRTPETGTAKGQTLLQTGHSPAHGEEPGQEKLIPPVSRVTNPSDKCAQTHVETVQSRENHLSNKPEQLENFTQSSLALETPAGQTDTSSKEISSAEISDPKGSSEAVGLSSRGPQSNSEGGASSDSILAGHQVSGKTNEGQTHGNKGDTTETSVEAPSSLKGTDRRASVEGSLVNKELKGSDTEGASSQSTVVNRVDADSVSHASASLGDVTHDPKPTVHVKSSATHSSGEQALDVVINNEGSSHTVPVREGNGDKAPACLTVSGRSAHSECTYDRNINQPVTSNNASHYKTVVDDTFLLCNHRKVKVLEMEQFIKMHNVQMKIPIVHPKHAKILDYLIQRMCMNSNKDKEKEYFLLLKAWHK
ncbi:hypothetical protein PVIIG_04612 [Plasmodium vivax India VII]|uniref:VIR protein n=1 Tax=Plasmodium vivax India VII TaxID=1077284 RepID=A0A0J9SJU3_PLAVI|nr:hypothetical protein PVIIG_04612 [Plasmodium vivax India VII]